METNIYSTDILTAISGIAIAIAGMGFLKLVFSSGNDAAT
jgi:hypothetical protein